MSCGRSSRITGNGKAVARPAHINAYHRAWSRANRGKTAAYNRKWLDKNPNTKERYRLEANAKRRSTQGAVALWVRYKLKASDWDKLFQEQNGCCAICQRVSKNSRDIKRPLVVDHCHESGKVRGLLCHNCNLTLGKYNDNPLWFDKLAAYLRKHATA